MKKYISPASWFTFEYPDGWNEFEDEAGTFLFYNPDSWDGSLRVSASLDSSKGFVHRVMQEELEQYADASVVKVGSWECVYSKETFQDNNAWYTSHFWVTGHENMAVYFTFTLPKDARCDVAFSIIESLSVLNPSSPSCHEVIPVRLMEIMVINDAYERVSKSVKNGLKKDFATNKVSDNIAYIQQMLDNGKFESEPNIWRYISIVLGCLLLEELDGIEWVTIVDGKLEIPALFYGKRSNFPVTLSLTDSDGFVLNLIEFVSHQLAKERSLKTIFEQLLDYQAKNC